MHKGNGGGEGFPGTKTPSGPGSTGGVSNNLGTGGTPMGAGSSKQKPSRSFSENTTRKRSTPSVSSKALSDVTDSMR